MQIRMMWMLGIAVAVVTAACGDSKSSLNPTAPSAASAATATVDANGNVVTSGAMHHKPGHGGGNGNGNGNGRDRDREPRTPANTSPDPTRPVPPGKSKVEFEGLIEAVSSGSILVNGQVILVTPETIIRHGNRMFDVSELRAGDRVHVRADRVAAPASAVGPVAEATLQATLILLQNPGDGDGEGEEDGLVSVTASDASASETGSNPGAFRLTRTGSPAQLALPLAVSFILSGTATNGSDYTAPLTATFLANETSVDVPITPAADDIAESAESVILTLTSVAPYELGSPITATVTITDTVNPLVSVSVEDGTVTEAGDAGRFMLTRTGDLAESLTVTVTFTGTAVNGTDYQVLATTVIIPALQSTANVDVTPLADSIEDPTEIVILTVVDGVGYDLGATPSAQITITGS